MFADGSGRRVRQLVHEQMVANQEGVFHGSGGDDIGLDQRGGQKQQEQDGDGPLGDGSARRFCGRVFRGRRFRGGRFHFRRLGRDWGRDWRESFGNGLRIWRDGICRVF